MTKKQKTRYSLIALAVLVALLVVANLVFDSYQLRILNLSGIYVVLALGLNLINGFTGLDLAWTGDDAERSEAWSVRHGVGKVESRATTEARLVNPGAPS